MNWKTNIPEGTAVCVDRFLFAVPGRPNSDKNEIPKKYLNRMQMSSAIVKQRKVTALTQTHSLRYSIFGDNG